MDGVLCDGGQCVDLLGNICKDFLIVDSVVLFFKVIGDILLVGFMNDYVGIFCINMSEVGWDFVD